MQPLDSMCMELCKNARCVEACFRDEFIRRVGAGGEKGGETRDGGGVWCTGAAHDYGYDVDHCAWPVVSDGVRKGCVFVTYEVGCVGEVVVCAVLPFSYLNFLWMRNVGDRWSDQRIGVRGCG